MSLRLATRHSTTIRAFRSTPAHYKPTFQLQHKRAINLPSHLHDLKLLPDSNMHAKASIDGTVIAETDKFEFVEGNVYFPPESLVNKDEFLTPSSDSHTTHCPWKGDSQYYDIHVNGKTFANAAWYYPQPLDKATHLRDYVAFCE